LVSGGVWLPSPGSWAAWEEPSTGAAEPAAVGAVNARPDQPQQNEACRLGEALKCSSKGRLAAKFAATCSDILSSSASCCFHQMAVVPGTAMTG